MITLGRGRQLFFDDYLFERRTLKREFHEAQQLSEHPILKPEFDYEQNDGPCPAAAPFGDGVFYDVQDQLYKMWYQAGWFGGVGYAESKDGLAWVKKGLVKGIHTQAEGYYRDGASVWLDNSGRLEWKYTMFIFYRLKHEGNKQAAFIYGSRDGIHFAKLADAGPCGDNTSMFYNPFLAKWVFSTRLFRNQVRVRDYMALPDLNREVLWAEGETIPWEETRSQDEADEGLGYVPQLYKLDCTPYESVMLGVYAVFLGPPNPIAKREQYPKIIDLKLGYSRDGFHYARPSFEPFLSSSRQKGTWNYGYLHSATGNFIVDGDRVYYYYGAFSGQSGQEGGTDMYAGSSTGAAYFRRDGFVSLTSVRDQDELLTRLLKPNGKYVFINADISGQLTAEITGKDGKPLYGYTMEESIPVTGDSTIKMLRWREKDSLEGISSEEGIKLRLNVSRGRLYALWFSESPKGESQGYIAGGGPRFDTHIDTKGTDAY